MSERKISSLYDNNPDTLLNLCLEYIIANLDIYSESDASKDCWRFKGDLILPAELCEKFLQLYQKKNCVNDHVASLFRNIFHTHLQVVRLRNSKVTSAGIQYLLEHKPKMIELMQCEYLSQTWLDLISNNSENLTTLKFGPLKYVFPINNPPLRQRCFVVNAPKLRRLSIQCRGLGVSPILLSRPLRHLTHLELSDYTSLGTTWALFDFKNLRTLVLHNVLWSIEVVNWVSGLHLLRHLDISHTNELHGVYFNPNETLDTLVTSLPYLEHLDISGTNLAGTGSAIPAVTEEGPSDANEGARVLCDIPGLASRVNRPLQFLGLYGTHHGACKRHDIPALVITGDANEEQILTAGVVYIERPGMMIRVLNDLYYMFRNTEKYNNYVGRTLCVVLNAMEHHVPEKHIQISGSAILFYIMKGKACLGIMLKKRVITALLNGMEAHVGDDTLMRNGCLTLCQFKIPTDVLFEYERVVQILLSGVADVNQEGFVQRIAIYLLNSLACQVDGKQKRFLGNHGAIGKMLNLISDRLERRVCDDVLEVAWSTMWNVTDETPQNCQRFLNNRGMQYFLDCLRYFPDKEELLRNMMGLLGNVAEVAELRPQLMDKMFLTVFYDLLNSSSDGIEVSYNAAGVLVHMASDGPQAWTVDEPSRSSVLERIAAAVERWDRSAERNINYRSFEPILTLLHVFHTPECQHWAVWALANLTTVYPDKYCPLVEAEGGIPLLYDLLRYTPPYPMIKKLALIVIKNCIAYRHVNCSPPPGSPDN